MQNVWSFLHRELRDAPGRANYTLRLTLSCAVLIVLFMTLQIPFLAVALIVVFYVSQPNVLMIKLVSVVFVLTVSVALGGVLLIIKWTYDYPLIRLVASVILFFCAIYLMRVLGKLGLAFFVVALAVIYAQTFPSMTSQSEILVRLLLWLWVAINTATPEIAASPQAWQSLMAAALSCSHLTALLQPGDDHPDARRRIASQLNALADNLPAAADVQPLIVPRDGANSAILQEIAEVLARLARGETIPLPQGEVEKAPLLLPDAWSNPAYLHFALKTLLATLLCYVFYTAADWQGIHTIMLSCVIVAQPGLGATMQKTWLRIGGALLATLIALLLIVFVQPWTDSLSGLLAMTLPVLALAAWIAAGSERIAYAGIQIGFTFALAFLSWFGPLSNLTELRDRVIGILLGVLVSSIVHLYLWPDSEAPQLKARLAQLYRQLAQTLAARDDEVQQVPLFAALTESETLINRVSAEPLGTYAHPWPEAKSWPARATFRQAEEILRLSESYRLYAAPEDTFLARCARRLEAYASDIDAQQNTVERVQAPQPDPANPFGAPLVNALAALPAWPFASSVIPRQATRS